jgi:phosphoglycerate dehydrogenase-like enzyme
MKTVMIGEAANHREKLSASLAQPCDIVCLPADAAGASTFDAEIDVADVVISLRYRRQGVGPRFALLHVPGAGLDGIDLASLPPGCTVCNVFEHDVPIAEFVMLAMLQWQIRLDEMRARFSPEAWSKAYGHRVPHGELLGKTLGLIGFGRIGRAIAVRAKAFGMRVMAVDQVMIDPADVAEVIMPPAELGRLLGEADFVAVTCPLTDSTRGLLDARSLRQMKQSAVLINISRAEVADEAALYVALEEGAIAGAFLDVWYRYPTKADDNVQPSRFPFHRLPQVYATPHSCAWTTALPYRRYAVIAENIRRWATGEPLLNLVHRVPDSPMRNETAYDESNQDY